jgi:hypothetical protein
MTLREAVQAYVDWQYRQRGARRFTLTDLRAALASSDDVAGSGETAGRSVSTTPPAVWPNHSAAPTTEAPPKLRVAPPPKGLLEVADSVALFLEAEVEHPRPDPKPAMRLHAEMLRAALASSDDVAGSGEHYDGCPRCEHCACAGVTRKPVLEEPDIRRPGALIDD